VVLDELSKKYFKLATKNKKSESPSRITCNCIMCGDKKNRLSLSAVNDEVGVCRCFNAGCVLNDHALPFPAFLKLANVTLYERYRREKFNKNLNSNDNLNSLLGDKKDEKTKKAEPIKEENINLPDAFGKLVLLKEVPKAREYVENRCVSEEIYKNWYFSKEAFISVLDKKYFVLNYLFIPIIQNNKLSGFYTRSIEEKRFSTILFPNREKFWSSDSILTKEHTYYIFEGIFDALSSGFEHVIAMLSADLSEEVLEKIEKPIFVFDNDETGRNKSIKEVENNNRVFIWPKEWDDFKDMNEALCSGISREDIQKTINSNISEGMIAIVKLKSKKI